MSEFLRFEFLFENETGNSEVPKHALEVAFVRLGCPEGNGNYVTAVCVVDLTRELRRPFQITDLVLYQNHECQIPARFGSGSFAPLHPR